MPDVITYSEYPKWLKHKSLDDVIVNDRDQEEKYLAKGYESKQAPNASENYLTAMATLKLDDAIRTMNDRIEAKIIDGLRDLYTRVVAIIHSETGRKSYDDYGYENDYDYAIYENEIKSQEKEPASDYTRIRDEFAAATKQLSFDAMQAVRDIAKGTD